MLTDQQIAQDQVLEILPMVSEVNAISEELNKHRSFEVVLVSAAAQEGYSKDRGTKWVDGHAWVVTTDFGSLSFISYMYYTYLQHFLCICL